MSKDYNRIRQLFAYAEAQAAMAKEQSAIAKEQTELAREEQTRAENCQKKLKEATEFSTRLEFSYQALRDHLGSTEQKLHDLREEHESNERTHSRREVTLTNAAREAEEALDDCRVKLGAIEKESENKEKQYEQLLSFQTSRIHEEEQELEDRERSLREREREVRELELRLKMPIDPLKYQKPTGDELRELQRQLDRAKKLCRDQSGKLLKEREVLRGQQVAIKAVEEEQKKVNGLVETLRDGVNELVKRYYTRHGPCVSCTELYSQNEALRFARQDCDRLNADLENSLQRHIEMEISLQRQLDEMATAHEKEVQACVNSFRAVETSMREDLNLRNDLQTALELQLAESTASLERAQAQVLSLEELVASLRGQLTALDEAHADLERVRRELADAVAELGVARAEALSLRTTVETLETALRTALETAVHGTLEQHQEEIAKLRAVQENELENLRELREITNAQHAEEIAALIARFEAMQKAQRDEMRTAQASQHEETREELAALRIKNLQLEAENEELRDVAGDEQDKHDSTLQSLKELQQFLGTVQDKLGEEEISFQRHTAELETLLQSRTEELVMAKVEAARARQFAEEQADKAEIAEEHAEEQATEARRLAERQLAVEQQLVERQRVERQLSAQLLAARQLAQQHPAVPQSCENLAREVDQLRALLATRPAEPLSLDNPEFWVTIAQTVQEDELREVAQNLYRRSRTLRT